LARISTLKPVRPSVAVGAIQRRFNPSALFSATNFDGASTVATSTAVSEGDADGDSVGSADCEIEGAGSATSSPVEPDLDQTMAASKTIPTTTTKTTRLDALCLGAATGFGVEGNEGVEGVEGVEGIEGRDELNGTGGTTIFDAASLDELFLAPRLAGVFLATFFFATFVAVAFFVDFLVALFFTTRLAVIFFLAAAFFAGVFFATFFAAIFFFTATITPRIVMRTPLTCVDYLSLPQAPQQLDDMRRN
jgi:hypothetical protein